MIDAAARRRIIATRLGHPAETRRRDVCVDAPGLTVIQDRQDHRYEAATVQARRSNSNQEGE